MPTVPSTTVNAGLTVALPSDMNTVGPVVPTQIGDGATPTVKATVAQVHNANHQALTSSANSLSTAGITEILTPDSNFGAGFADRARGTGFDNIPAVGIPPGAQQHASPLLS